MKHALFAMALTLAAGSSLRADPPFAMYLFPAGGQRGTTVDVAVGGTCLNQSCRFEMLGTGITAPSTISRTTAPFFEGPLLPLPESQRAEDYPRAMAALLKIDPAAKPGPRYARMWTSQGVTLPLTFVVGDLPEIMEREAVDDMPAGRIVFSSTANGRIFPRENVDRWIVPLKKGQTVHAALAASEFGSPLEARLHVVDPSGRRILESRDSVRVDPSVRFTAAADGDYSISVSDIRNDGGPSYVYRLTLTPEAVQRPLSAGAAEGTLIAVPFTGNGVIGKPDEVDTWPLTAQAGDAFEIDLDAQRIDSSLIGVISVFDAAGKVVAQAESTATGDPSLRLVAPAAGNYTVRVQDRFPQRAGPEHIYRLRVRSSQPDIELQIAVPSLTVARGSQIALRVTATRKGGYAGPIYLSMNGLPKGVTLAKNPVILPNQPQIDILVKADDSARIDSFPVSVTGMIMPPVTVLKPIPQVITRNALCRIGQDEFPEVRLAVAIPTPFKIAGDFLMQLVPRGTQHGRTYRIERTGYDGPIEIELAERQARHLQGVTAGRIAVPAGATGFSYDVTLPPWMETGRTCRICVMGTATIKDADGSEHVVTYSSKDQNDQIIAVIEPERLSLSLEQQTLRVLAGKSGTIEVTVSRGEGLKVPVRVEVLFAEKAGITISPIDIPADASAGVLKWNASDKMNVLPRRPITIRATAIDGKRTVTAEAKLELVK